jgi:hypothetical protein
MKKLTTMGLKCLWKETPPLKPALSGFFPLTLRISSVQTYSLAVYYLINQFGINILSGRSFTGNVFSMPGNKGFLPNL